ncbi:hypothetical protein BDQ12DRAFT_576930, partial [Crucibulum laeve]
MEAECPDCGAYHWKAERLSSSSNRRPKYGTCCLSGKIQLPSLGDTPDELQRLLHKDHSVMNHNIRQYNNALAMTSLGCKIDNSIHDGHGPYVFKVHGALHHYAGSLIPNQGVPKKYAQLYIYDSSTDAGVGDRIAAHTANRNLNQDVMRELQNMLYNHHYGVQQYKAAYELTRNIPANENCKIALHFNADTDQRRYNLPTTDELAVILPGLGDQPEDSRDIVLHLRGGGLTQISEIHPQYWPLHYVLLFPQGQPGWH